MVKEYGYEYDATLFDELYNQSKGKITKKTLFGAICLRSGRDALKAVAREFSPVTVLMPALACESMILPFEMYGHNVCYYKLKEDYSIDLDDLENKIPEQDSIFLYMNYFGKEAISDNELKGLRNKFKKLYFIKDSTHDLFYKKKTSFIPDFTVFSLRKWINIPDGGLLWANKALKNNNFGMDLSFFETRLKAQILRKEFLKTGNQTIKSEYRAIFSRVSDILDKDLIPVRMSKYSYEIAIKTDWNKLVSTRKNNAKKLIELLSDSPVKFIQNESGISDLYVPFLVNNRSEIQNALSAKGIFNTIIWPLKNEQKNICSVAECTQSNMLAAPCDQRYTVNDMEYIGKEIVRVIIEQKNNDSRC